MSLAAPRQALAALLFLYREALQVDLQWVDGIVRAKQAQRLPVVLTRAEVARLWDQIPQASRRGLVLRLLYGTGMRLTEGLRLRAQDVAVAALDHIGDLQRGVGEWRTLALSLQAQVKHQADCRESELVTLLKDILHCSDVFASFRPDLHARLLDFGRRLKAQEPKDDFPDDYEV